MHDTFLHAIRRFALLCGIFLLSVFVTAQVQAPKTFFGVEPGADYTLIGNGDLVTYYKDLAAKSEEVELVDLGSSTDGRPMILLLISSKENIRQAANLKDISRKLAEGKIDKKEAANLIAKGKAIVWVDTGLHANELATAQMAPLLAYKIATDNSPEVHKIRENVLLLLMPVMNPDGLDMWHSWYNKQLNTPWEVSQVPWLWQRYVGHDNNRDWFMGNMVETRNVMKVLYEEWFPQIVYNHHQPAQNKAWERIFIPPFRSPVNPNIPSGVTAAVNEVGSAMMKRFSKEDMPGALSRYTYSMFWNGGMRTVPYYHNMIGLLSETVHGSPTPRYYDPKDKPKTIGSTNITTDGTDISYPYPWEGGWSRFGDAVKYALTATMAVLDYAADRKDNLLEGMYDMASASVKKGETEGPFAYIIPRKQWDDGEAADLIRVLMRGGVEVHEADRSFTYDKITYPKGTFILYAAQAFRPYLIDLMEAQDYPHQAQYPGGPPMLPYDLTGWTLPFQFGLKTVRAENKFTVPTTKITSAENIAEEGKTEGKGTYYLLNPRRNNSIKAVNEILNQGLTVKRTLKEIKTQSHTLPEGAFYIEGLDKSQAEALAKKYNTDFTATAELQDKNLVKKIREPQIGLYKSWKANMDAGWTEWLLTREYQFKVDTLHDGDIKNRDLSRLNAIILPSQAPKDLLHGYNIRQMPAEYTGGLGMEGLSRLEQFVKAGGTLIAFDQSADLLIDLFGLPVRNVVKDLSNDKFLIPGSLIQATVDTKDPLAWGVQDTISTSFQRSRAFAIDQTFQRGHSGEVEPVEELAAQVYSPVNYSVNEKDLLLSGWMLGGQRIAGKSALVSMPYGKGAIVLFGFRPQFRGQTHSTYKLIFNALYNATFEE